MTWRSGRSVMVSLQSMRYVRKRYKNSHTSPWCAALILYYIHLLFARAFCSFFGPEGKISLLYIFLAKIFVKFIHICGLIFSLFCAKMLYVRSLPKFAGGFHNQSVQRRLNRTMSINQWGRAHLWASRPLNLLFINITRIIGRATYFSWVVQYSHGKFYLRARDISEAYRE